jgi:hypothetical protein
VPDEVGSDHAGVHGVGGSLRASQAPRQLLGEQQIGELRLAVETPWVVAALAS